jgi:hypothetical protein
MRFGRYIVGLPSVDTDFGFSPHDPSPGRPLRAMEESDEVDDNGPAHAEADAMV